MFSSMKMNEYMESELSGIFKVRLVVKNMVLRSPGTHFMHFRVDKIMCIAATDAEDRESLSKLNEKLETLAISTKKQASITGSFSFLKTLSI